MAALQPMSAAPIARNHFDRISDVVTADRFKCSAVRPRPLFLHGLGQIASFILMALRAAAMGDGVDAPRRHWCARVEVLITT